MSSSSFPSAPGLLGPIFELGGAGERPIREALFLTFNVDLGFFESRLLGPVRASGAAVTVIADAGVFAPDPRTGLGAGSSYALGLAHHTHAFHPKLTVLVGPEDVLIGIGSGNLSVGGWHSNRETLVAVRGDAQRVPEIVIDVARFLRDLPTHVPVGSIAAEGVLRTAASLEKIVEHSGVVGTGHRLVHTLHEPILDQLPAEPVDSLELAAPFHDPRGLALDSLLQRFQPSEVLLLAQPGQAVMDPQRLAAVAARHGVTLDFQDTVEPAGHQSRYRHGKIITALRGGSPVWSLTGSPNLTAAALLSTVANGNCEVGVFSPYVGSLMPAPTTPIQDLAPLHHRIEVSDKGERHAGDGPRFLEAEIVEGGILITLSGPVESDLPVEVNRFTSAPDHYEVLGKVLAGEMTCLLEEELPPGTPIRIGSQLQRIADRSLVTRRIAESRSGRSNRSMSPIDLFADSVAAELWQRTLAKLVLSPGAHASTQVATHNSASSSAPAEGHWRTLDDPDNWGTYEGESLARLGLPMLTLAAGPAGLSAVGSRLPSSAPAWEDDFSETPDAFEDESMGQEELDRQAEQQESQESAIERTEHQKSRYRRWLNDLVNLMPALGPLETIAAAQLCLVGSTTELWSGPTGERGWFDVLGGAFDQLAGLDWPDRLRDQAAAVGALLAIRMRQATPPDERGAEAAALRHRLDESRAFLLGATEQSLEANVELASGFNLIERGAEDLLIELQEMLESDPDAELLNKLERLFPEFEIEWLAPRQLVVRGKSTAPARTAAQVLVHADDHPELAIGVNTPRGPWAVVARARNRLTVVEGKGTKRLFRTYRLREFTNPLAVLSDSELAQTLRVSDPPWNQPGPEDLEVLGLLGVDSWPIGLSEGA